MPKLRTYDTTPDRELVEALYPWHLFPISTTDKGKAPRLKRDWALPVKPEEWRPSDLIGAATGGRSFDVVDFDIDKSEGGTGALITDPREVEPWKSYIEAHKPLMASTPSGGVHLFLQGGSLAKYGNRTGLKGGIDFRTDGGYVVLPSSGEEHRNWLASVTNARPGPVGPLLAHLEEELVPKAPKSKSGKALRSQISDLVEELMHGAEGSRNDKLAAIAGHLVNRIPEEDAFKAVMRALNAAQPLPLDETELEATVYKMHARVIDPSSGKATKSDLVKSQDGLMWLYHEEKAGAPRVWVKWLRGVVEPLVRYSRDEGPDTWLVRLTPDDTKEPREIELSGAHLGDNKALMRTLAGYGILLDPRGPRSVDHGTLLGDWLKHCEHERGHEAAHWGWNGKEWVGLGETKGPSAYKLKLGRIEEAKAQEVLRAMATWQAPEIAAIFCSWIAANAVKGFVPVGFEPNLVVKGRAGSGKTKGLFGFGSRLTGAPHSVSATVPVIRDALARHRNGIVVLDDVDDTKGLIEELYRQSTQSGSVTKKSGPGFTEEQETPLLGSFMVTGETLGQFNKDAALMHRTIELEIESMQGRASILVEGGDQWADITEVYESLGAHDEASAYAMAGTFVELCLGAAEGVRPPEGSRSSAKVDYVRMGAEVFDRAAGGDVRLYDGSSLLDAVERWCFDEGERTGWEQTALVARILPEAWGVYNEAVNVLKVMKDARGKAVVRIHVEGLAAWWEARHKGDKRAIDLGSAENIRNEHHYIATELGIDGARIKTGFGLGSKERKHAYELPAEVLRVMQERSGVIGPDPRVYKEAADAIETLRDHGLL